MNLRLNWWVIGFAVAITAITTVLFGLAPALRASRPDLVPVLKDEVSGLGMSKSLLRSSLVVTQVALSLVALVCAGLFLRALGKAQEVDIGVAHPEQLLIVVHQRVPRGIHATRPARDGGQLLQRIRAMPGRVPRRRRPTRRSASAGNSSQSLTVDGYTPARDENMSIQYAYVSGGLLRDLGHDAVQGRWHHEQDQATPRK
jgi:hypothetical protein